MQTEVSLKEILEESPSSHTNQVREPLLPHQSGAHRIRTFGGVSILSQVQPNVPSWHMPKTFLKLCRTILGMKKTLKQYLTK